MSDKNSKGDWFKHLHVQVALWEEKGVHTGSPSTRGCTCKKSCIDGIKHCLTKRLNLCKIKNLTPKMYEGEVDAFFEFLKHEKINTKRITKLVQRRNCVVCLLNFDRLNDLERQQVIDRFETHNIESLVESVHTLTGVLRSTPNIHSGVSPESYIEAETRFNDTTWLRHIDKLCLKKLNKVVGRMKWGKKTNGRDPNNAHKNPVTGAKQYKSRDTLISELRLLVPQCLQQFSCPRPYREEVQLLLAFLETGVPDKKKIQREEKLRNLAIGLNKALLKVLEMENDLNEIIKNIEPSRRSQLVTCLADLGHRLEVRSQNTDELQAFSEDEQTSNQSNHDHETDRRKGPLVDAIGYSDEESTEDPVTEKMMNVSNPKATSNGSKEEMIDFDMNGEPSCSHEKTYDLTFPDDRESNDSLLLPLGLLGVSAPTRHCLDLEQEITHHPLLSDIEANSCNIAHAALSNNSLTHSLISDNILDQSFHQLLDAAKAMPFHCDLLDTVNTQEHQLSGDKISGQEDITVSNPESEYYRCMADLKQSTPTDTSTQKISDLILSGTMQNVSQSPLAIDSTEVDPSNKEDVLDVFSVLGEEIIVSMDGSKLWKINERMQGLNTLLRTRLQQTALQSEGSSGIGILVTDSGSSNSAPAIFSSDVEPDLNGSFPQSSQASEENRRNTKGRKRKRRIADD